eukprot:COSAG05_NODE_651_length_8095_cov_17.048572_5_plen_640_part_00
MLTYGTGYSCLADIWSIGVLMYVLLCGQLPFNGADEKQAVEAVQRAPLVFPSPAWDEISEEAKSLLQDCMLCRDPAQRWTAESLLAHPWLSGAAPSDRPLSRAVSGLKSFNAKRKFQQAVRAVILGRRLGKGFGLSNGISRQDLIAGRMALDFGKAHTLADAKSLIMDLRKAADELHGIMADPAAAAAASADDDSEAHDSAPALAEVTPTVARPHAATGGSFPGSGSGSSRATGRRRSLEPGSFSPPALMANSSAGKSSSRRRRGSISMAHNAPRFSKARTFMLQESGSIEDLDAAGRSTPSSSWEDRMSSPALLVAGGRGLPRSNSASSATVTPSRSGRRGSLPASHTAALTAEGGQRGDPSVSPLLASSQSSSSSSQQQPHHRNSHRHIIPVETFGEVLDETLGLNGDDTMIHAHLEVFATGFLRRWVDYLAYVVGLSTIFGTSTEDKLGCAFDVLDTDHDGVLDLYSTEVELLIDSVLGLVGHIDTESEAGLLHDLSMYRRAECGSPRPDERCPITKSEFVDACKGIPQMIHYFISVASLAAHVQSTDGAAHSTEFASSLGKHAHSASAIHQQLLFANRQRHQQHEPVGSMPISLPNSVEESTVRNRASGDQEQLPELVVGSLDTALRLSLGSRDT